MSNIDTKTDHSNIKALERRLQDEPETSWQQRGEAMALNLFHAMARRVPAYQDFLKINNFSASSVKTIEDFHQVPTIDKDNYLRKYPKEMLCWDGQFGGGQWQISTTSGSTGQPYYFPRQKLQDEQYAEMAELYLRANFKIHKRKTLYVIAFPMGAWIGGLFTYEALQIVASRGYDLSVIAPGIHKLEVINAVKQLAGNFDQIIIGAYAPFLKDILDDGTRAGIDWTKLNVGFVFSAEAFSEKFRDYVMKVVASDEPLKASLNHYGTVDLGTMAHETPESVMIRRYLVQENKLAALLPENNRQPTLAQFNPEQFYFEEVDHNLLCSARSGLPLVRYNLKDYGGVISRADVHARLAAAGLDVASAAKKQGIGGTLRNLPFVYVYERYDFSVSYYAFSIYPDTIRRALQHEELHQLVTGKFSMSAEYDAEGRQRLNIHVETKHGVKHGRELSLKVKTALHEALLEESSEYRETARTVGQEAEPIIYLWDYEDPTHFRVGTKQKWVIK